MPCKNCIESWEQRNFVRDGEQAQSAPVAAPWGHFQDFPGRRSALALWRSQPGPPTAPPQPRRPGVSSRLVSAPGASSARGLVSAPGVERQAARASCAWVESERDSRISEILIQPVGWAEASRRWQSPISQDLRERVIDACREAK
jgi:hypothetical protein